MRGNPAGSELLYFLRVGASFCSLESSSSVTIFRLQGVSSVRGWGQGHGFQVVADPDRSVVKNRIAGWAILLSRFSSLNLDCR